MTKKVPTSTKRGWEVVGFQQAETVNGVVNETGIGVSGDQSVEDENGALTVMGCSGGNGLEKGIEEGRSRVVTLS